jgi:signal transduction histidine kinase
LWDNIKSGKSWQGIIRNLDKNGKEYIVDAKIFPIRYLDGRVEYISIRTDITQYALQKEKEILDASEKLKIVLSSHGLILDFNQKAQDIFKTLQVNKTLGESLSVAYGKQKVNSNDSHFVTAINKILIDILFNDKFDNTEVVRYKDKVFLLEASKMSRDFILSFDDITDLEQVKYKYSVELEESKDKMLVMFTHELKTPLNGIIGFSESLSKRLNRALRKEIKPKDIEKYIKIADDINALGNILYETVVSLLDSAKLKNGKYEFDKTRFVLSKKLSEPIELFSRIYHAVIETDLDDFEIYSDKDAINHIFANLFSNALKYGGGEVLVVVKQKGDKFHLSVEDNGEGVSDRDKVRIFEMFDQLDNQELTREAQGTGIGLYFVKQLCNVLNYDIRIEKSERLGGASFVVEGKIDI